MRRSFPKEPSRLPESDLVSTMLDTYSDKWVDLLVEEIADDQKFAAIKAVKVG